MTESDADPKFSDVCGENIELSDNRKRARWRHKYSAGRLFASRPMKAAEQLDVLLDGSGHVGIGILKSDPGELKNLRESESGNCKPKLVTDIRVHKRECLVSIRLRQVDKAKKLDISYVGQKVVVKVKNEDTIWLTFELKFGSVVVKFRSSDMCFHQNAGRNIRFLDKDRKSAKLDVEYPAVTCCLWRKLRVNEYVTFSVLPLKDGDKDPSTYHVVLGVSQLDATQLRSRDPESFRSDSRVPVPYRWKVINRFDKDVCYGEIRVGIGPNGKIRAFHSGGFETEMDFDPGIKSTRYLFVLNLFRTEVRIKDLVVEEAVYDYALQSFRKASTKSKNESLYIDIIGDDVPVIRGDVVEQNEQDLRRVKSRSYPMALPNQTETDQRTSLNLRPRQPSDNYYDDVAVGTPDDDDVNMEDAVYNDVIHDATLSVSLDTETSDKRSSPKIESNIESEHLNQKSQIPELHYDVIEVQTASTSPKSPKKNKSPMILRKPVSKLMDKVAGIKNVFTKRAEHPYDDIDDPVSSPAHTITGNLNMTLRSVPSNGSDVVENTYWEVQEIPRVQKREDLKQESLEIKSEDSDLQSDTALISTSPKLNKGTSLELRHKVQTMENEIRTPGKLKIDRDLQQDAKKNDEKSSGDVEDTGNAVNVKMLIQKFGGNEHAQTCTVRQKNLRPPLLHTSPSAPVLANRSHSDETLAHSRSQETLREENETSADPEVQKKSALLSDTFESINVLLNIGKGKKRKDKQKAGK